MVVVGVEHSDIYRYWLLLTIVFLFSSFVSFHFQLPYDPVAKKRHCLFYCYLYLSIIWICKSACDRSHALSLIVFVPNSVCYRINWLISFVFLLLLCVVMSNSICFSCCVLLVSKRFVFWYLIFGYCRIISVWIVSVCVFVIESVEFIHKTESAA